MRHLHVNKPSEVLAVQALKLGGLLAVNYLESDSSGCRVVSKVTSHKRNSVPEE